MTDQSDWSNSSTEDSIFKPDDSSIPDESVSESGSEWAAPDHNSPKRAGFGTSQPLAPNEIPSEVNLEPFLQTLRSLDLQTPIRHDLLTKFFLWISPMTRLYSQSCLGALIREDPDVVLLAIYCCASLKYADQGRKKQNEMIKESNMFFETLKLSFHSPRANYAYVICLLMTAFYVTSLPTADPGINVVDVALGLSRALGLDQDPDPEIHSPSESQIRRLIWWAIWEVDRYGSILKDLTVALYCNPQLVSYPTVPGTVNVSDSYDLRTSPIAKKSKLLSDPLKLLQQTAESSWGFERSSCESRVPLIKDILVYHLELCKIWTEIYDFVRKEAVTLTTATDTAILTSITEEHIEVDNKLTQWFSSLPGSLQIVHDIYQADENWYPGIYPPWSAAFMLSLYHHCRIHLHIGLVSRAVQFGLYNTFHTDPYFHKCVDSTLQIYQIMRVFAKHNPLSRQVVPLVSYTFVSAAQILAILGLTRMHTHWNLTRRQIALYLQEILDCILTMATEWPFILVFAEQVRRCIRFDDPRFLTYERPRAKDIVTSPYV